MLRLTYTPASGKPTLENRVVGWGEIFFPHSDPHKPPRFNFSVVMKKPGAGFRYEVLIREHHCTNKDGTVHYRVLATQYADTIWGAKHIAKKTCRQRIRRFADE